MFTEDFTSYKWRMRSSSQISKIKTSHCVLGERHPVLVAGLAVNEKVRTVGDPQRVPTVSAQPFEGSVVIRGQQVTCQKP